MGERTTLSGHIQEPWYVSLNDRETRRLWQANRHVIKSLPVHDIWPPLPKRMFSVSPSSSSRDGHIKPTYRGSVIYFGGSFSYLWPDWEEWLEKFEGVLRRLYWEHAIVVVSHEFMGHYVYRWDANREERAAWGLTRPNPIQSWEFTGGPRKF